ncbi:hypothetical protein SAMD00019534_096710, partial [Acytostelium subglobosum LB1]|uniref:hypothetical protein n=1 Tax=Acytostelium subglobosum LB1 TaxID=1410327 RepID=UPI0006450B4D
IFSKIKKMTKTKTFGHCVVELVKGTDDVYFLKLNGDENKFNPVNIKNINDALDYIEKIEEASCLITVGTNQKFYSTGLDLDWMLQAPVEEKRSFIGSFHKLLGRFLTFPMPTIAILNGHTYAGGAMLASAHDFRLMRKDRGFYCLPEVDIHIPLTPGMNAILQAKISDSATYRDAVLRGMKFSGNECVKHKIVDAALEESELVPHALELASKVAPKGKDRDTFGGLKREMYKHPFAVLQLPTLGESEKLL